ncbi:MAG: BolA family protein [Pseudomonadota bacterium]
MSVAETIRQKLTKSFAPESLEVIDESHLHAGHAGARPEGETHFRIRMTTTAFEGKSRVERQRAVNTALRDELEGPVHALAMEVKAEGE